ncbi:hypothetical protein C0W59_22300, partial [Photobacterium kishitanii]
MPLKVFNFKSVVIPIIIFLSGCGGEDSSSETTPVPQPPPTTEKQLVALDGFSSVTPDMKTFVDLSPFVRGDNAQILSVSEQGNDIRCGSPEIKGIGLDILAENGAYCDYSYVVKSGNIQSQAHLKVLATSATTAILPPLSQSILLDTIKTFNLKALLGSDWPSGYTLNSDSIEIQSASEGNIGTIDTVSGNSITYKAPELSGWNRFVYTISNPDKVGEDKLGIVNIAISEHINQPPKIGDTKYESFGYVDTSISPPASYARTYDLTSGDSAFFKELLSSAGMTKLLNEVDTAKIDLACSIHADVTLPSGIKFNGKKIAIYRDCYLGFNIIFNDFVFMTTNNETYIFENKNGTWYVSPSSLYAYDDYNIDLSTAPGLNIIEPDGQEWQLIDVQSITATVKPKDPDSVTNKAFTFTSSLPGDNFVSYIIADHYGSYASGVMKISLQSWVSGNTRWDALTSHLGYQFSAPLNYILGGQSGYQVWPLYDDEPATTVSLYSSDSAQAYCQSIGHLPTKAQMDDLRQTHWKIDGSGELNKWPKGSVSTPVNYFIESSDGVISTYNIATGVVTPYSGGHFYTTCVRNTHLNLTMLQTEV